MKTEGEPRLLKPDWSGLNFKRGGALKKLVDYSVSIIPISYFFYKPKIIA